MRESKITYDEAQQAVLKTVRDKAKEYVGVNGFFLSGLEVSTACEIFDINLPEDVADYLKFSDKINFDPEKIVGLKDPVELKRVVQEEVSSLYQRITSPED